MSRKYDVVATIGTYQKDGETKYVTRNVGSVIETKHGLRLAMDASFNPAGCQKSEDGKVWLALFEPKPQDGQQPQQRAAQTPGQRARQDQAPAQAPAFDDFDDELPPF